MEQSLGFNSLCDDVSNGVCMVMPQMVSSFLVARNSTEHGRTGRTGGQTGGTGQTYRRQTDGSGGGPSMVALRTISVYLPA